MLHIQCEICKENMQHSGTFGTILNHFENGPFEDIMHSLTKVIKPSWNEKILAETQLEQLEKGR